MDVRIGPYRRLNPEVLMLSNCGVEAHLYLGKWLELRQRQTSHEFPGGAVVKNLPASAGDTGDTGSIPGAGRSPGGENGSHSSIIA